MTARVGLGKSQRQTLDFGPGLKVLGEKVNKKSKFSKKSKVTPPNTNNHPKFRRHRIREGRFGEAPPSNHTFFAEVGCSGRKRTFPLPGSAKNSDVSTFSELFAPRLLPERHRSIKSAQNSYFLLVRSNRHTTTRNAGRSRSIPSIWDSGFV